MTPNQTIWDIDKFADGSISEGELERLKESLLDIQEELEEQRREADSDLRKIKKEEKDAREELKELKQGKKAYPRELEEARYELRNRLHERCGKFVNVQILADLLDIKDERWHNAIEGYLGGNKLLLVVEPGYAREAMDIYQGMDRKKYYRAAVLDTEKVMEDGHQAKAGSLAEEIVAKEPYVRAYIDFFLGNVMKCESIEELREHRIGITPDCVLYHSYRLQHINPENYTRRAYIGETSMRSVSASWKRNARNYRKSVCLCRRCWRKSERLCSWKCCCSRSPIIWAGYLIWNRFRQKNEGRSRS